MPVYTSGVKLSASGATEFLRSMTQARGAVEAFQTQVAKGAAFNTGAASSAFAKLTAEATRAGQQAGAGMASGFGSGMSALETVTQGALLRVGSIVTNTVVGAFAAAGKAASQAFGDALDFQQAVANISSLADGGVSAAGAVGQAIGAVATDPKLIANTQSAALAFQQLEKQGLATADILGTGMNDSILRATVSLQNAAGQAGNLTELRESAEVVGQGMALFGLEAAEAGGLVDAFAAITTNTKFDLNDLNYILANSATAIQALGLTYTDIGSTAIATGKSFSSARTQATALESFLLRLSAPTDKAREALDLLGVSAYDSSGQFVGLVQLQDQLQEAFSNGQYTGEAFAQLLVEAFGLTGSAMATALAQGEDLTVSMQTLGATSAEAIAAIKTDTLLVALQNLGDVASDLARRLLQPFVEGLTPAVQAASAMLSGLAGTFDFLGQRIAASLSPVINFVTAQFNTLAQTIAAVTGASISLPSLGAMPTASPAIGPAPRPITANSDASAANRAQAAQAQMQEQIGREQLEAARQVAKGGGALKSALLSIEDVLSASRVSDLDMRLSKEGLYQDSTDEFLRRLQAAAESGGSQFGETIEMARAALDKVGIAPAQDLLTLYEQTAAAWQSGELFADKENIALINKAAVEEKAASKKRAEEGRANVAAAFGGLVAGIADGASAGVGAAPVAYQAGLATGTEAQAQLQESLNTAINSQIQGVADGINGQGSNAFFNPADLYGKQAEQQQAQGGIFASLTAQLEPLQMGLGLVTGLFEGLNAIITGITDAIAGQDFTAAGAAVSGTLTTVLDALTGVTELADIEATTANLSSFVQTLLDSAASFVDGLDGTAITESASNLLGAVIDAITGAFDSADTGGIVESAGGLLISVAGFLGEAITGVDLAGIATSAAGMALAVGGQIAGAIQNIKFGEIGLASLSLVNKLGGQIATAITDFAGSLEAVDMTQVTTILGGAVESVTGFAADITAIDLTGVNEARAAVGEAVAGVATTIATAVDGLDGEAIGADISTFASNLVGLLADGIKAVPLEEIGVAAANLVGALASTFREAFTIDNLAGVGESIGGLLTGIVEQLTATLGNPAFGDSLGAALGDLVAGIIQGAAGLLQGLSGGLEGEAVAGIGGAIGTFVQSFVEGLAGSLVSADWSGIGTAIYEGITGAALTLFSGAEGLADAIFAVPFELGKSLEENTGIASGTINFFAETAEKLKADLASAFASDSLYTADIGSGIGGAGLSLSSDISTAFAKDAIYPPELALNFSSIASSISGAFTTIYDAIAGFFSGLTSLLPSLPSLPELPSLSSFFGGEGAAEPLALAPESKATLDNFVAVAATPAEAFDPNVYAAANNFDGEGLLDVVRETSDAQIAAMEDQTKALKPATGLDGSGALINAGTVAELEKLGTSSTTVTTAQATAAQAAQGTATVHGEISESLQTSGGDLSELFGDMTGISEQMVEAFDILRPEIAGAAADFDGLDTALTAYADVLEGAPGDLTEAFDALVNAIVNAMEKIDGAVDGDTPPPAETPTNTPPGNGPRPFAQGTHSYPGGRGLAGEEGPELYITPGGMAGMLGMGGPELFTAPAGTQIYPAHVTQHILGRGARSIGGDGIFAAAGGAGFNSTLFGDLPSLPPVTIPQGPDSEVTRDEPAAATSNNGISSDLLAQFLQGLGQSGLTVPGFNPGQLAQQVSNAAGNTAKTTAQQIAELFTKPLFGGRYSAPQTQVINISVKDSHDNVTNQTVNNFGGLQVRSMRSTENLARDFRLLQAVNG